MALIIDKTEILVKYGKKKKRDRRGNHVRARSTGKKNLTKQEEKIKKKKIRNHRLTFGFDFLVVEQQRHHFLRLQGVRFEITTTDYHALDLRDLYICIYKGYSFRASFRCMLTYTDLRSNGAAAYVICHAMLASLRDIKVPIYFIKKNKIMNFCKSPHSFRAPFGGCAPL